MFIGICFFALAAECVVKICGLTPKSPCIRMYYFYYHTLLLQELRKIASENDNVHILELGKTYLIFIIFY